jgi:hypothetical protein
MAFDFPIVITSTGLQPQAPSSIQQKLVTNVAATNPGYTANLPASLIEDISSTEVGGIVLCDQAKVELINSLTPNGANEFLLTQLGQVYGVPQDQPTNTSVSVVFSGTVGYVIPNGFLVADGSGNSYQVQGGGVIGSGGSSSAISAIATNSATLAPPAGTVTHLVTSIPSASLNPPTQNAATTSTTGGTLAAGTYYYVVTAINSNGETTKSNEQSVTTTGTTSSNTVSWASVSGATGYRIYRGTAAGGENTNFTVNSGSTTSYVDTGTAGTSGTPPATNTTALSLSVTNPLAGTSSTGAESPESYRSRVLQAGLAASVGTPRFIKTQVANVPGVASNLVSVQQSGTSLRVVVGGSPNVYQVAYAIFTAIDNPGILTGSAINAARNVTVSLNDYPDTYTIEYVSSPQQTVTLSVTWNTILSNFTGGAAFPSLVQQPLVDYINGIAIGNPINVMEMNQVFQEAVSSLLDPSLLTRLVFTVFINGVSTAPAAGTYAVSGDAEGYFNATASGITVTQG